MAGAGLTLTLWASSFFASERNTTLIVPDIYFAPLPLLDPNASSARLEGTIASPIAGGAVNFTLSTDGVARLYIDEHLLIDVTTASAGTIVNFTSIEPWLTVANGTADIRLEYSRVLNGTASPSVLQLFWSAGDAVPARVPGDAFTTFVSPNQQARRNLRAQMMIPRIPWQTYVYDSMGEHVLMPCGFTLEATLGNVVTGELLGNVRVFRNGDPAFVRVGPHSPNGSDYTELNVSKWHGVDCVVTLRTTTVGDDIAILAHGADGGSCDSLALVIRPRMAWGGAGTVTLVNSSVIAAHIPGAGAAGSARTVTFTSVSGPRDATFAEAGPVYVAWRLRGASPVGGATGTAAGAGTDALAAAMRDARRATLARRDAFPGELADVWDAAQAAIWWNTIFSPYEGVITPVSRLWDFGAGYVLFCWDNLFAAFVAGSDRAARDVAYANVIQTLMGRTQAGLVPNYASGTHVSRDRSEPQVGAIVVRILHHRFGDDWLVSSVFDALLGWHNWVWSARTGNGTNMPLVSLGSSPYPDCTAQDWSCDIMQGAVCGDVCMVQPSVRLRRHRCTYSLRVSNNCRGQFLAGARFESGLDNSPMYDGVDVDSQGYGPVTYDASSHTMDLYDAGATGLFLADTEALIDLAAIAGRADVVPVLRQRFARVAEAAQAHLWSAYTGTYVNVLNSGATVPRLSPTSLFPLIAGIASDEQVVATARFAAAPDGLCLNASYTGDHGDNYAAPLVQWHNAVNGNSAALVSDVSTTRAVRDGFAFVRVEAAVRNDTYPGSAPNDEELNLFVRSADGATALVLGSIAPAPGYEFVRREGWCFAQTNAPISASVNLTWWRRDTGGNSTFITCGTPACVTAAAIAGFVNQVGLQCAAYDGRNPATLPCKVPGPSIARGDAAFSDMNYWRGRAWGPHAQVRLLLLVP